jgi:hypothetical protein|tara:strand:+ start:203 stop:799 length:597 start_codon:yes stop_codon:yes gene_type:complete
MVKTETKRERSIRNKSEYAGRKASGKDQIKEKKKESAHVGKTPVPFKEDVGFWDNFFSKIESGETLHGFAVSHGMTDQVLRDRLRRGELHERFIEAHQGRAVYHAQSIEGMIDRLEAGDVESDVARVSIDARKWLATKYFPRMFGERQEVNLKTTDMTKVYVEQLKILMSNQEQRVRTIEVKSEVKLVTEEKDDTEGE